MKNPVGWFEIYVDDMARAKAFYEQVFGDTLEQLPSPEIEMWAFGMDPTAGGAGGALVKAPGWGAGKNSVLVYFKCNDCAVEAGKVKVAGGKIEKEKFSIGPFGFIALAHDTEGNMFGLHSMQ